DAFQALHPWIKLSETGNLPFYRAAILTSFLLNKMHDEIDRVIIAALMEDSRLSLKALARASGLSSPSVAERLRRLEERGVLTGYTVNVDPRSFGYMLQAIVRVRPLPGRMHAVGRLNPDDTECARCGK